MTKDEEIAALKDAFDEFTRTSVVLSQSYDALKKQVETLSYQLSVAEQEKRQEANKNQILLAQFHQLFESMPIGMLLLNDEGMVAMANAIALRLFGFSLIGEMWSHIVPKAFAPQEDDGHEVTMVTGRRVRVETSSLGAMPGQLVILVDLTETHKLQKQLAHHERLSNMGKMVAALAHQIRTPLSSATLYAGHLQNAQLTLAMREKFAHKLMGRLQDIERQIRDMLIFSKSDIRLDQKIPVNVFLNELEQQLLDVAQQRHVILQFLWPQTELSAMLQCNQNTLIGALLNLLNNAIEASSERPDACVQVKSFIDGQLMTIVFTDNGVGMSQEQLDRVQQGFVTTKQHGTGLGLMVVKAIARAHHGEFNIKSELGIGTQATVSLPLIRV